MRSSSRAVLAGSAFALLLAACGGSKNEKAIDYVTPGVDPGKLSAAALQVPPDLITPMRDDRYVVPDASPRTASTYSGYAADRQPVVAASGVAATAPVVKPSTSSDIRMERDGSQRWLVVKADKESVWPKLQDFWKNNGLVLVTDDSRTGIQETDWASNRAKIKGNVWQELMSKGLGSYYSTDEQDKFRLRVETLATPGTVEIYISHRGMLEVMNGTNDTGTHWEPRARDSELEAAMLQRLMVNLGVEEVVAKQQLTTALAPVVAIERAKLSNAVDGSLQLAVSDPVDRAWRQIGLALDRTGVVVEDRDRAKGVYFVRYIAEEDPKMQKQSNWFVRMFDWSSKKDLGTDQFQVEVTGDAQQAVVRLKNKDGAAAPAPSAKKILNLLYNELK